MGKRFKGAPASMDDFAPFYLKGGKLWVPYQSGDDWHLHFIDPLKTWKAINYAIAVIGNAGVVVPFALSALRKDRRA